MRGTDCRQRVRLTDEQVIEIENNCVGNCPDRRWSRRRVLALVLVLSPAGIAPAACAERAVILADAASGAVLHAEHARLPSYPASLTKLMTLYLAFGALRDGRIAAADPVPVSAAAAAAPPVRLGLKAGSAITFDEAITALIVTSGNDVARALAEAIGGDESTFVGQMNAAAARLGLTDTRFRNASGLPDPDQITTAGDMLRLAIALRRDYPADYARFATKSFAFAGRQRETHNNFLRAYRGALGLKTGFTCRAGYNLVAAAERDGRQLIGVVLGGATAGARDARMVRLMDAGFLGAAKPVFALDALPGRDRQGAGEPVNRSFIAEQCINPQPGRRYFKVRDWTILLGGVDLTRREALARARAFMREHKRLLKGGRPLLMPRWARNVIYQIGITGLTRQNATNTCLGIRSVQTYCVVRSPHAAQYAMQQALRVMDAVSQDDQARPAAP